MEEKILTTDSSIKAMQKCCRNSARYLLTQDPSGKFAESLEVLAYENIEIQDMLDILADQLGKEELLEEIKEWSVKHDL